MRQSKCTSCEIGADKSAYWTPQLYYQHADGSFEDVPNNGMVVYYLGRGDNRANMKPFPPGFRMLSGSANARSYDNTTMTFNNATVRGRPVADRVSFNCLDSTSKYPETPGMINTRCSNGLRAQIHFQSCWDGVNLYKSDNSHVAYMSQIDNGVCPPTHPVQLVQLFFEVLYGVAQIDQTDGGRFVLANGDPTGFGFHGDFMNGWDPEVLAPALQQCANTDNGGSIAACAPLAVSQSSEYSRNCPERPSLINEPVRGNLSKLPGCINVVNGPAAATSADMTCPSNVTPPTVNPFTKSTANQIPFYPTVNQNYNGWTYLGCTNDLVNNNRALNVYHTSDDGMTTSMCQAYCASKGQPLAALEYGNECYCGSALASDATSCANTPNNVMVCAGNSTEYCGGPSRLQVFNSTTIKAVQPFPSAVGATIGNARYFGCATEVSGRALRDSSKTDSAMTISMCASFCSKYALFGLEYGGECYCGNQLASGSNLAPSADCAMACNGNNTQLCGGPNRLTVFNNTAYQPVQVVPSVGAYQSQGCYYEPYANGGSGRALSGASYSSGNNMTVENCVNYCTGKNYAVAGLEYSGECYCGNALAAGATAAPAGDCKMTCSGNGLQYCGAGGRLNIYKKAASSRIMRRMPVV